MKKYAIAMEVAGPLAMWARPDTGSSPTSYPIPTWSAAKGLFESVAFFSNSRAWINPTHVEICKPVNQDSNGEVRYQKYMTNYGGPLRDTTLIKKKANYQFSALAVAEVCYRVHAQIEKGTKQPLSHGHDPCHALQAIFNRRLNFGQCYHTPCLGWSEFVPHYWGPFRDNTEIDSKVTLNLVSVLKSVFDSATHGQYDPHFQQDCDAWVQEGVFRYAQ